MKAAVSKMRKLALAAAPQPEVGVSPEEPPLAPAYNF
jgi:hypothetical protein